uniref:Uncharacterized protein n=1 Tax=virus sp. ctx9V1 TaxID=2828001 RepID=A0A8S5RCV4_9VIRU|nr:MAG TPA: hypothetical protein [virus sp. ctx9V1]
MNIRSICILKSIIFYRIIVFRSIYFIFLLCKRFYMRLCIFVLCIYFSSRSIVLVPLLSIRIINSIC